MAEFIGNMISQALKLPGNTVRIAIYYTVICFFFVGSLSKVIALPTIAIAIVVALSRSGDSDKITIT